MTDSSPPARPPRRKRYKGTHPKTFADKYKERGGEKEVAEKIFAKGGTPAGTHRPIMVQEILAHLQPKPGGLYVDATLGYGGHASAILEKIDTTGRLIAFDRDPIERAKTEARLRELFHDRQITIVAGDFSTAEDYLKRQNLLGQVDGFLADLGLSSMQIDDPDRGFTFKREGPLDLRMNPMAGEPASALLARASLEDLTRWLEEYSDEPRAKWCAQAILKKQKAKPILTTTDLASTVRDWIKTLGPSTREKEGDTPIRRAFQALRIVVNDEFGSLEKLLDSLPRILKPGGSAAILSFHSGEDRRVKKSFQNGFRNGTYSFISDEAKRPSLDEQRANSRSKPAKLRLSKR